MNVVLINLWDKLSYGYNLGLLYVIAAVRDKGFRVHLLDLHYVPYRKHLSLVNRCIAFIKPQVIGFSVNSFTYPYALLLAKMIKVKYPKIKIIFSGVHPTILPEQTLKNDFIDAVCIGEGEESFCEYLECVSKNIPPNVKGIWYKKKGEIVRNPLRPFKKDIDQLPFPAKDSIDLKKYLIFSTIHIGSLPYLASRGCPYNCFYCNSPTIGEIVPGRYYRMRSPENVILEIEHDLAKYAKLGFTNVFFHDETFGKDISWFSEFVRLFKKERLHKYLTWSCQTRADIVTPEWVRLAAESGCISVLLGAEAGDERFRYKNYNKRISDNQLTSAIKLLKKYKIIVVLTFIITPQIETEYNLSKMINLIKGTKPHVLLFHRYLTLPKAKLSERLEKVRRDQYVVSEKTINYFQKKLKLYSLILKLYYFIILGWNLRTIKKVLNKKMIRLFTQRIPTKNTSIIELLYRLLIFYVELIRR